MVLSTEQVLELTSKFLIYKKGEALSSLDEIKKNIPTTYAELFESSRYNLNSLLSVLELPFTLAFSGLAIRHFERVAIAESIKALNAEDDNTRELEARARAIERYEEFLSSSSCGSTISVELYHFFSHTYEKFGVSSAAKSLLEQSLVTLWSIIEVLFRDAFEMHLNKNPAKVTQLLENEDARKRLGEVRKLSLDELVQYEFDISKRIGTYLIEKTDFSKLANIKAYIPPLFKPCPDLIEQLGQSDLWLLNQRRHLFVHRAGIVDKEYIKNTGHQETLGKRLYIDPDIVEVHISTAVKLVTTLFKALPRVEE